MTNKSLSLRFAQTVQQHGNREVVAFLALLLWLSATVGCGLEAGVPEGELGAQGMENMVVKQAELSTNGLSTNGLSTNGLSTNGLSTNGLSTNGLLTDSFKNWFEVDPTNHAMLMNYLVLCAVAPGETRTYLSATTGYLYTWTGLFGLAPGWSSGAPATVDEQQLVTACLAAHANKFGLHIAISMLGQKADGGAIPYTDTELTTYSRTEGCFFGNAFSGEGIFSATDRGYLQPAESTTRACGLTWQNASVDCSPIQHVGSCADYCTLDATNTYYTQCNYMGVTYRPLTTRILPTDVFTCGDGVCQLTEKCGTGTTADSCAADCGACAP